MSSVYTDQVVPRLLHLAMSRRAFSDLRRETLVSAAGTVLEVGFGSGLNLPFYPASVERILALEPSEVARKIARSQISASSFPVEFIGLDGQKIPLPDASVDQVVSTWTLCSIPDAGRALREFVRVLKPSGKLIFVEHGRSAEPSIAKWQDRLTPLQKVLAGGCHLNRQVDELIESAGFRMETLKKFYIRGPRIGMFMYQGCAVKTDSV